MNKLSILVVSDLHVGTSHEHELDTKLIVNGTPNIYGQALIEYLKQLERKIDILVCAGDIGNKGCKETFKAGWSFLNTLASELSIDDVLCVPGNHDHQSRPSDESNPSGFSPKHELQFTDPPFPFNDYYKNTHFWAWNWELTQSENYNCISINSSAYHGFGSEFRHGRVALEVSKQIKDRLSQEDVKSKPLNLLICHHHPQKMDYVDVSYDGEAMEGADYLLSNIEAADIGPWLIIHGHKHYATISYGNSRTSTPPTILSAGSLSAVLYESIDSRTSNQFYLLEIDIDKSSQNGKVVGRFETYESNKLHQWQPSKSHNLPACGGFGSLYTPEQILNHLKSKINESNSFLEGDELNEFRDKIFNLPPFEFKRLERLLEKNGFMISREFSGEITEVGKRYE
ncbi:TPA: metallophosphoesterase [Vibrio vulnificus]|jgi:3',5'-cyclic AMP phosphodiesterase CpdA|uniref:metallophosphoesterase family protein n=1 Tax=Vibrio parahaemolyticus TaxID=670 RepID=UPI001A90803C|nr:metallophosphoesterase [Vibrio parahaemolyticus]EGR0130279.1 metallophosphoesterase [Vibrio vulnificus]EKO3427026.1 metallophosphoesterase [Vibrio fluvialis]EGQ8234631.1 hypothetical protein [Vibrio parahaemolyticus]EJA3098462.1 metallophosphoesterase [Vibrio parahaemolyticus]MBO0157944.1 metallophosphoesterase [Vibrio parahaemolyticus]